MLQLDEWTESFEEREKASAAAAAAGEDDGWTVVTRKPVSLQAFLAPATLWIWTSS